MLPWCCEVHEQRCCLDNKKSVQNSDGCIFFVVEACRFAGQVRLELGRWSRVSALGDAALFAPKIQNDVSSKDSDLPALEMSCYRLLEVSLQPRNMPSTRARYSTVRGRVARLRVHDERSMTPRVPPHKLRVDAASG